MTLATALRMWHGKEIIYRDYQVIELVIQTVTIRIKEERTLKYNCGQIWKKTTVSK